MKRKFLTLVISAIALFSMTSCAGTNGADGKDGTDGKDGVSIISITKTRTDGLEDTYTITYSDESTSTFVVTNGADGAAGIQGEPGADGHSPTVEINQDGYWVIDGVVTEILATGQSGTPGKDGTSFHTGNGAPDNSLGIDGDSYLDLDTWDFYTKNEGVWTKGGNIKGDKGDAPVIEIGENGNWFVDGVDTGVSSKGESGADGTNGEDGSTPYIGENGNWWIGEEDTGIKAEGKDGTDGVDGENGKDGADGLTPYIGENGNWWIGEEDTGVKAEGKDGTDGVDGENGKDGADGLTPYIGENGNWWIGEEDTGVKAEVETPVEEVKYYSVTFDLNGGEFAGNIDLEQFKSIEESTSIDLPIPYRDSCVFEGWYTGKLPTDSEFTNTTLVNQDITLIAKWTSIRNYHETYTYRADRINGIYDYVNANIGFENLSDEQYQQMLVFIGNVNFAADNNEIDMAMFDFYYWLESLPVDEQKIINLRENFNTMWSSSTTSYPAIVEDENINQKYNELATRLEQDSMTISEFNNINSLFEDFRWAINDWINTNTVDEDRREECLINARSELEYLKILFEGIHLPTDEATLYLDTAYLEELINKIEVAESNKYMGEAFDCFYQERNRYFNEYYSDKITNNDENRENTLTFLKDVASNVYSYCINEYNNLKGKYGFADDEYFYLFESIKYFQDVSVGTIEPEKWELSDVYDRLTYILYEFENINNRFTYRVRINALAPYAALVYSNIPSETFGFILNETVDLTEFVNTYSYEGFRFIGLTYENGEFIQLEADENGSYILNLNEEVIFDQNNYNYSFSAAYELEDAEIAKEAIRIYVDESIEFLKESAASVGVDITDYQEYIDNIYLAVDGIIDQTTFEVYLDACDEFTLAAAKDSFIKDMQSKYNELLTNYPFLIEDASFETYNEQYLALLEETKNASTKEEFMKCNQAFYSLYNEVLWYAEKVANQA